MRTSSLANQLNLNFPDAPSDGATSSPTSPGAVQSPTGAPPVEEAVRAPTFAQGSVYAATARLAGRLNASAVSKDEHENLLAERQVLLDKHFAGTITYKETNRLEYVRWSLDRIEDAKYGISMDVIDNAVSRYENLLKEMMDLKTQLESRLPKRK